MKWGTGLHSPSYRAAVPRFIKGLGREFTASGTALERLAVAQLAIKSFTSYGIAFIPILSQLNPVQTLRSCSFTAHLNIIILSAPTFPKRYLAFRVSGKYCYAFLIFRM
jgi:hypothetical protein